MRRLLLAGLVVLGAVMAAGTADVAFAPKAVEAIPTQCRIPPYLDRVGDWGYTFCNAGTGLHRARLRQVMVIGTIVIVDYKRGPWKGPGEASVVFADPGWEARRIRMIRV